MLLNCHRYWEHHSLLCFYGCDWFLSSLSLQTGVLQRNQSHLRSNSVLWTFLEGKYRSESLLRCGTPSEVRKSDSRSVLRSHEGRLLSKAWVSHHCALRCIDTLHGHLWVLWVHRREINNFSVRFLSTRGRLYRWSGSKLVLIYNEAGKQPSGRVLPPKRIR